MSTLIVVAVLVVGLAGVLGVVIRARLAAVDEEARRRGHIVIGSHGGTRLYSNAAWNACRMERARAEVAKRRQEAADLLLAAPHGGAIPQHHSTTTAVRP